MASDYPIVRYQVEGLGQKIAAMIALHSDEADRAVEKAVNALAANGELERLVTSAVADHLSAAVKRAVESFEVQDAIRAVVLDALRGKRRGKA